VDIDDVLTDVAAKIGAAYGMTAEQVLLYVAIGSRRHDDAPAGFCGMVDPRHEDRWCILDLGHQGNHSRY
jgi:hypothetical protein